MINISRYLVTCGNHALLVGLSTVFCLLCQGEQVTKYLIEAVAATLCEEDLDIGMAKQVVLQHPVYNPDIVTDRQAGVPQHDQVRLGQLPDHFGWGYCRKPLSYGFQFCYLCKDIRMDDYERELTCLRHVSTSMMLSIMA